MKHFQYRLIALDIDGTLLNSRKEVAPETLAAVREAARAGISVVFCTGRSVAELEEMSGLDFLPGLESFIAKPLKAHVPTRLWPVGFFGAFRQMAFRFR